MRVTALPRSPPPTPSDERETSPGAPPRSRKAVAVVVGVVAVVAVGGLWLRSAFRGTTVTVANVGERTIDGIVVLAVAEGAGTVRAEWPIGVLRAGEARDVEDVFAADTVLAVRFVAQDGTVAESRLGDYLGSPASRRVRVEIARDGVRGGRRGLKPGP
jgi:hypothetical protein